MMGGMDREIQPASPSQQRNVEAIAKVEAAVLGERSTGERGVRWLIRKVGTPGSVLIHLALLAAWIGWNAGRPGGAESFDPYPFPLLSLAASIEAIVLGLLILTSQNRLQHEADRRAHLSLQIGLMAELEATKILQILDRLCRHAGIRGADPELIAELSADTDPGTIAESLKASMPVEE